MRLGRVKLNAGRRTDASYEERNKVNDCFAFLPELPFSLRVPRSTTR